MTKPQRPAPTAPQPAPASAAEVLDLCGEVCPFTFVRTRLALEALPLGSVLTVRVDHEPAARNVPRSAAAWGQTVEDVRDRGDGRWDIVVRKRVS